MTSKSSARTGSIRTQFSRPTNLPVWEMDNISLRNWDVSRPLRSLQQV
jgi:hypothetical protein